MKKAYDHTEGSVIGSIFRMGFPSMIGFAALNIYDIVDMFWVAKLGAEPVAAITIFSAFYWVVTAANQIAGTGSLAVISRRYGEKDYQQTERAIKDTILLKWMLAVFFGLIGFFLIDKILVLLGARGEVLDLGIKYGKVQFLGLGFVFSTFTIYTALRGIGNPSMAMGLMLGSTTLNLILDPFLIFGWWIFPELGVVGAAVASVISFTIAFLTGLLVFFSGKCNVTLHLKSQVSLKTKSILKIIRIGLPTGINDISFSFARLVIMPLVAVFGTEVVAIYGVGMRISSLGIMIIVGLGLGLSALIGQNLGARKLDRAQKTADQASLLAVGIMTFFGLINFVFAPFIVKIFFQAPNMVSLGATLLRIQAIGFPLLGLYITLEMIFAGAGDNVPPMIIGIIYSWVLEIPLILVFTRIFGFNQNGVWWAIVLATFVGSSLFYYWYRKGKWIKRAV
jgi:putative MATE family efflux protein